MSSMEDAVSVIECALAGSGASSARDAVVLVVHSSLLTAGYECTAINDQVGHWRGMFTIIMFMYCAMIGV